MERDDFEEKICSNSANPTVDQSLYRHDVTNDCKKHFLSLRSETINTRFYRGSFKDMNLVIDNETGYFNGTLFCATRQRNIADWLNTESYKSFNDYCVGTLKLPSVSYVVENYECNDYNEVNGRYVHGAALGILFSWTLRRVELPGM